MGNLAFISFRRAVSDEQFTDMLQTVIRDNYDDFMQVVVAEYSDGLAWNVIVKDDVLEEGEGSTYSYSMHIFRHTNYKTGKDYKGKFAHKHMRGWAFGEWFMYQFHAHLCQKFGAMLSDEGVSGSWKADPKTYPTVRDYLVGNYDYYRENKEGLDKWLETIPKKLREIRG